MRSKSELNDVVRCVFIHGRHVRHQHGGGCQWPGLQSESRQFKRDADRDRFTEICGLVADFRDDAEQCSRSSDLIPSGLLSSRLLFTVHDAPNRTDAVGSDERFKRRILEKAVEHRGFEDEHGSQSRFLIQRDNQSA